MRSMKKQETAKTIGILILLGALLLFVFYKVVQNTSRNQEKPTEKTEYEQLMEYDFANAYPQTVRDVMRLYMRYLDYIYSEDISEEQIAALNNKMRNLYTEELLALNDEETQLNALKEERAAYKKDKILFVSYTMTEASQIVYDTIKEEEFAKLNVIMTIKAGYSIDKAQEYVLKKDEDGNWKIYGWTLTTNSSISGQ